MTLPDHLYVHVPFCESKCAYCTFFSRPYRPAAANAFLAALETEWERELPRHEPFAPRTIYMGGGTPSVLDADRFARLIAMFTDRIRRDRLEEWTVEVNPASIDAGKLRLLRAAGVSRISLGAQSFNDRVLAAAGRPHPAARIGSAIAAAREAGFENVGLDLIAGLPGQDAAIWRSDLGAAVALAPKHISVYALTLEPGCRLKRRSFQELSDAAMLSRIAVAEAFLKQAGFARYEISNYALPGAECRHNLAVWRGEDYIGLGPAAASRAGTRRWTNAADLTRYVACRNSGKPPPREADRLSEDDDTAERMVFGLRLAEGVDIGCFAAPGSARHAAWTRALTRMDGEGLVAARGGRWRLTARGREFADTVASELL